MAVQMGFMVKKLTLEQGSVFNIIGGFRSLIDD
jgi:hypothetical protein